MLTIVATILMLIFALLSYQRTSTIRELNGRLQNIEQDLGEIKQWHTWWNKNVPGMDADQNARLRTLGAQM